jgi:hypothetical protein
LDSSALPSLNSDNAILGEGRLINRHQPIHRFGKSSNEMTIS